VYKARDGYIFLVIQQHEIGRLWRAMKRPDLAEDPRFKTNRDRVKNKEVLRDLIERWLDSFPDRASALKVLDAERVPCAPVLKLEESMAEPHLRGRKTVRRIRNEALGEFDVPGMPVKFSGWPDRTEVKASRVGADNAAIMSELLGMSPEEIERLHREQILLSAPPSEQT
jgi:crotonobetainyl-CoA:carnitine CoA-transferase CaiB-like acyl-CoA transferase